MRSATQSNSVIVFARESNDLSSLARTFKLFVGHWSFRYNDAGMPLKFKRGSDWTGQIMKYRVELVARGNAVRTLDDPYLGGKTKREENWGMKTDGHGHLKIFLPEKSDRQGTI